MNDLKIRDIVEADFKAILEINKYEEIQTSSLDIKKLFHLHSLAYYRKVITIQGDIAAFLLAICHGKLYENDNYIWFSSRFRHFVYIDRIVVSPKFSRLGLASFMYDDLFTTTESITPSLNLIACEYNIEPANLASKAFHDKLGFREIGKQYVANGSKLVSLQVAEPFNLTNHVKRINND